MPKHNLLILRSCIVQECPKWNCKISSLFCYDHQLEYDKRWKAEKVRSDRAGMLADIKILTEMKVDRKFLKRLGKSIMALRGLTKEQKRFLGIED